MPPKGQVTPCIECGNNAMARGLCSKHYQHHKKRGTLPPPKPKVCKVDDCDNLIEGLGYCRSHYRMFKKHGDPLIKGKSSTTFTSEQMRTRWEDPEYRAAMIEQLSGENNPCFKGAKIDLVCVVCGDGFTTYPNYNGVERKYCSVECSSKCAQRVQKISKANTGKRPTAETLKKLSESHIGVNAGPLHPKWKGGISKIGQMLRGSKEYARWRQSVFERDDYTCQLCGERGGRLQADHYPFPFSKYPDKRLDLDNGRTLCRSCHHHVTYVTKEWRSA